jgi:hypothetical protein
VSGPPKSPTTALPSPIPVEILPELEQQLDRDFGVGTAAQLIEDFREWKQPGPSGWDDHWAFGKDANNRGSTCLFHVHMIPANNSSEEEKWLSNYEADPPRSRKSDRLLFYAYGGNRIGYLLMELVDDPGGHDVFTDKRRPTRVIWEGIARTWADLGKKPLNEGNVG